MMELKFDARVGIMASS